MDIRFFFQVLCYVLLSSKLQFSSIYGGGGEEAVVASDMSDISEPSGLSDASKGSEVKSQFPVL